MVMDVDRVHVEGAGVELGVVNGYLFDASNIFLRNYPDLLVACFLSNSIYLYGHTVGYMT